ncbi:hypothetical protein GDO78_006981 [Eleutherodactylus coqui]|uniref:Uncharacterized protein n=1 Tax=Eleutherodactylus coqui TaxID=57060 RepID=A0A8J6KCQ3_ELECQ|nr:hypothetical protein GDO78_006981 [Eleutherodactylus coqui]
MSNNKFLHGDTAILCVISLNSPPKPLIHLASRAKAPTLVSQRSTLPQGFQSSTMLLILKVTGLLVWQVQYLELLCFHQHIFFASISLWLLSSVHMLPS